MASTADSGAHHQVPQKTRVMVASTPHAWAQSKQSLETDTQPPVRGGSRTDDLSINRYWRPVIEGLDPNIRLTVRLEVSDGV